MATLQYPLEHQDDAIGRISFEAFEEPQIAAQLMDLTIPTTETVGGGGQEDEARRRNSTESVGGRRLGDILADALPGDIQAFTGALGGTSTSANSTRTSQGRVNLYMPQAVQIQDLASYDNSFNLGPLGGAIVGGVNNAQSIINAASTDGGISGFISKIAGNNGGDMAALAALEAAKYGPGAIGGAAGGIGGLIGGAVISAGIIPAATVLGRVTTNPNTRTIFKSVPIRQFQFTFDLIPSSKREADEIRKIIEFFRLNIDPEAFGLGGTIGLKFPNTFDIKLSYRNREIPGVKFLTCYLQNFGATYNQNGGSMHEDGNWNSVQVSLGFTEIRALNKQDIRGGY